METASGRVEAVHNQQITILVATPVACRRCATGKGCGAGLLTGTERERRIDVALPPGMHLEPGDRVSLGIAPGQLLRAAGIAYGIPLIALVGAAGLAALAGRSPGDGPAIAMALAGLAIGVLISRRILARHRACEFYVPTIEERAGP